ncbi:MAG: hypothetical protein EA376_05710 [Phycisphaeraceae bacterium]|nr:MAG: hypothetical protein EA376_05710 [Phycisphaeraceae bacterium]
MGAEDGRGGHADSFVFFCGDGGVQQTRGGLRRSACESQSMLDFDDALEGLDLAADFGRFDQLDEL